MKKVKFYLLIALVSVGLVGTSCDDDDDGPSNTEERIEELALTSGWNQYLVAAASELYDDCVALWAAWNGPNGLTDDEKNIIGNDFFTKWNSTISAAGYAHVLSTAGSNNILNSEVGAIRMIIEDGCVNIATEVGGQKIGGPNGYAKDGNMTKAVLEVESWYSFNSITDYTDNIVSIRNSYFGNRVSEDFWNQASASEHSLLNFVKSMDEDLNDEVVEAIYNAYDKIYDITWPFRNNLTGPEVDAAMDACADVVDIFEQRVIPLLANAGNYDFTPILENYATAVVVPTYADMKSEAKKLYDAAVAFEKNPTQANMGKVCDAWKNTRVPWEQSEAFLYGPADALGLDPSLDSWPLDQNDIWGILSDINDGKYTSVANIISAIQSDEIRGFHTIELLLFKDGENRPVK